MIASQRYPDDYDGIVAAAPAFSWPALGAGQMQTQQAMYPDPSQLTTPVVTADNRSLLQREILSACDTLDGVKDGVLTDPRQCRFDPATLPRCTSGQAPDCPTEVQLDAIEAVYNGPVADGQQVFPGFPFGGENDVGGWDRWITGGGSYASEAAPNLHFAFSTQMYKYLVFDDRDFDYSSYDFANWHEDIAAADTLLSATSTDLGALGDRGGKMIFWHGWSDPALTAFATIEYYEGVLNDTHAAEDFTRLYMLPGVLHCAGGPGADRVDWLGVISNWVEKGEAPGHLVANKYRSDGTVSFTRKLCPYPMVAQYDGQGDPHRRGQLQVSQHDSLVLPAVDHVHASTSHPRLEYSEDLQPTCRSRRRFFRGTQGRDLRLDRPQRRRQDDHNGVRRRPFAHLNGERSRSWRSIPSRTPTSCKTESGSSFKNPSYRNASRSGRRFISGHRSTPARSTATDCSSSLV